MATAAPALMVQPVELLLAKLTQRIKVRVEKHEAPSTKLLGSIIEHLAQPEAPLLACCKVLMASLDIFSRLIREYDPNVHTKAFCLMLTILRRMCMIGGKPAVGRQEDTNNDQGQGGVDANGYRLQGVRERMLHAEIVVNVLDAALVSTERAVDNAVVSFLCDFALEEKVCELALPEALLRLLTNNRCHCKRTACILISRICADPAARMVLLNADADRSSREWISLALPQFWLTLVDTSPSLLTASVRVQAAETLAQLYLSLSDTEVGLSIANTMSSALLACTTEEGMRLLASRRYQVMDDADTGTDPFGCDYGHNHTTTVTSASANAAAAAAAAGVAGTVTPLLIVVTEVVVRVVLEVKRQHAADNEVVLAPLREQGMLLALCVSLLRAREVEKREREGLETLREQFDLAPLAQQADLYTPLALQRNRVRDLEAQVEALFGVLGVWSDADDELLWSVRVMLLRHRFPDDCGPVTQLLSSFFRNADAAAALNKELVQDLQQTFRLAALKRILDDAVRAGNMEKHSRPPITYEPALLDVGHPSDAVPTFPLQSITARDRDGEAGLALQDSSTLGYLLLKRLYERNGYDGAPTKEDKRAILTAMQHTSSDPHEKRQVIPTDFRQPESGTAGAGSGTGTVHVTDEELDMTLKKMTFCGLRPGAPAKHQHHAEFLETDNDRSPRRLGKSGESSRSPTSPKSPKSLRSTGGMGPASPVHTTREPSQQQLQQRTPTKPSGMKPARRAHPDSLAKRRQVQVQVQCNSTVPPQAQTRTQTQAHAHEHEHAQGKDGKDELNFEVTGNVIKMDKKSVQSRLAPYCIDTLIALADNTSTNTNITYITQPQSVSELHEKGYSNKSANDSDFVDVLRVDGANLPSPVLGDGSPSLAEYMSSLEKKGPPRKRETAPFTDVQHSMTVETACGVGAGSNQKGKGGNRGRDKSGYSETKRGKNSENSGTGPKSNKKQGMVLEKIKIVKS